MNKVVPDINNPDFKRFITQFLSEDVRPANGVNSVRQKDDRKIVVVQKKYTKSYKADYCWFNCKEHQRNHGGKVVFGWALWKTDDRYVSQNHAVWESPEGFLYDVTPDQDGHESILFMPDGRSPFCYENFKTPFNFEMTSAGDYYWVAHDGEKANRFYIGVLTVTDKDQYVIDLLKKWDIMKKP